MSCNYAEGLSPYEDKGKLGLPEKFDSKDQIRKKCMTLSKWIQEATHVVVHTGAGISTSAGIPDFRGPNGVWTLEAKGEKPDVNVSFNDARPTETHMALVALAKAGKIHHVISQNIDGLHMKSGLERKYISEVHGNMFVERCNKCNREWMRRTCVTSVGQKEVGKPCPGRKANGLPCRGVLRDTILDWEHELPELDLQQADVHARSATLSICLGTTLQIVPAGNLPLLAQKNGGRVVICNLQPTKHDKKANLLINTYVDVICDHLLQILQVSPIEYDVEIDPTQGRVLGEWTVDESVLKELEFTLKRTRRRRKLPAKYQDSDIDLYVETETEISRTGRKRRVTKVKLKQAKNAKIEVKTEESETGFTSKIKVDVSDRSHSLVAESSGKSSVDYGCGSTLVTAFRTVCIPRPRKSPGKVEHKEEEEIISESCGDET